MPKPRPAAQPATRVPTSPPAQARSPRDPGPGTPRVPAVERAVRLLDELAASRQPASLSALTRSLNLPKSSVHGLLQTLASLDLASRTADGEFRLGPRVLQWADAYRLQSDLIGAFNELAGALGAGRSPLAGDTVMLAVLDGAEVLYLACVQGSSPLAVNFRVGGRFPASCTSSGKAILATLDSAEVRACLTGNAQQPDVSSAPSAAGRRPSTALPKLTRHSVATHSALERQLARIRTQGYAIDDEETAEGMKCFGAPIIAGGGTRAVAAVAVSLIKASVTPRRCNETIAAIRELARQLSERLGNAAASRA